MGGTLSAFAKDATGGRHQSGAAPSFVSVESGLHRRSARRFPGFRAIHADGKSAVLSRAGRELDLACK